MFQIHGIQTALLAAKEVAGTGAAGHDRTKGTTNPGAGENRENRFGSRAST